MQADIAIIIIAQCLRMTIAAILSSLTKQKVCILKKFLQTFFVEKLSFKKRLL